MPDGKTYSIEGPAGATDEQVIAAVQRRLGAAGAADTTLRGEVREAVKGVIPGAAGLLETAATGAAALLPEEQEMAVRARAAQLAGATREAFAAAPGYEESVGRKFGEALGSTVPFFGVGALGAAGRVAAMGLGAGAGAGEARQRAEMEGGEEEKGLATAAGAAIGISEAFPVFNFVKRLPRDAQLSIADRIRRAFQAAGEEGAQEVAAAIGQNLIARGLYKPSQELIEGVGEEGAYGAGVGAFIQVLTDMALGRRVRGVQPDTTARDQLTQPETPPTAPPGTQAAAAEEVAKQRETAETVKQAITEQDEEARLEREAVIAYEREQEELARRQAEALTDEEQARLEEEALRQEFEAERLRDAAEAERLAPEEREGVEITPPVVEKPAVVEPTVAVEEPAVVEPTVAEPTVAIEEPAAPAVEPVEVSDVRSLALETIQTEPTIKAISEATGLNQPQAAAVMREFVDEGIVERVGNKFRLVTPEAADVSGAPTDVAEVDVGAGRGGVEVSSLRPPAAQPSVEAVGPAGLGAVGDVVERADVGEADVSAPLETPSRPAELRTKALDFIRRTGKGSATELQKELGIPLREAGILREALLGSGAVVQKANVKGAKTAKRSYFVVEGDYVPQPTVTRETAAPETDEAQEAVLEEARQQAAARQRGEGVESEIEIAQREADKAAERQLKQKLPPTLKPEIGKGEYGLRYTDKNGGTVYRAFESTGERNEARANLAKEGNKDFGTFSRMAEAAKFELDYARRQTTPAMTPAQVKRAVEGVRAGMTKLRDQLGLFTEAEAPTPKKPVPPRVTRKEVVDYANNVIKLARESGKLKRYSNRLRAILFTAQQGEGNLREEFAQLQRIETNIRKADAELGEATQAELEDVETGLEVTRKSRDGDVLRVKGREESYEPLDFRTLRFSRGTGVGMDADRVYDTVTKIASKWKNSPRIFVVQSVNELPDTLRNQVPDASKGFYIRGDVFLIADNINSDADARATLFHESLGHFGLRSLFGRRIYQLMRDIYRTNPEMRKAADGWLKNNPDAYNKMSREDQIGLAVEEVLAESSAQGQFKQRPGIRGAFERLVALVRQFARDMGIPVTYTNNDVRQVLIQAHDVVTTRSREQRLDDSTIVMRRRQAQERLSDVFDVNITAPEYNSQIGDGVRGALGRVTDNIRDAAISFLSIPQIAEVWKSELPAVEKLDILLGQRGATEMARREHVSNNVSKWFELANEYKGKEATLNKFFKVANLTTVYQVDPLSPNVQAVLKKPRDKMTPFDRVAYDIVNEYNRLPPDLRQAYKELREEYETQSKQLFKLMESRLGKDVVDRLKAKYDSKRLQVYLPLWRSGNYWLTYTDKNNETITAAYASELDRQRATEAARKEGGRDFQNFVRLNDARRQGPPPTGFLGDVVREMEAKNAPQDMIDAVYETFLNYLPAESIRQMYRPREASFDVATGVDRYGVFGFEPDVFQAYANVGTRIANQLTNLEYAIPLEKTLEDIKAQAGGERITNPTLRAVYDNLQKQVNFIRFPEPNWLVDGASYFSYLWFIAGNISSALINTTQLPLVVMPLISGKYGYDKGFAALEKAMSTYFNGGWDSNNKGKNAFPSDFTFGATANLSPEYKKLYDTAVSRSIIRRSTGYEITEAQKAGTQDYVGTKARVVHGLGWLFQNSERFNREVTLLAAFDLAYEKTGDVDKAIEEAMKIVTDAHGTALAETGPRLFQAGFGKVMFTFKRFAQAQLYLLSKLFKQSFSDADPETREVARSQLLGIFGSAFLIAGIQGMPMYGAVEFLANLLMGDDDEPYDFNAYVTEKFGETGRKGLLNQMIGVDVASRTGFNGLIWRDDPKRMAEVGPFLYTLEQAMGPAYGAFLSAQRGVELFQQDEYMRAIEALTPSFIRNGFKTLRMAEEGVRNRDGTPIVENISDYNLMMQLVGFNPREVAEKRESASVDAKIRDKITQRRSSLLDKYYAAWQEGDREAIQEALNNIRKFNQKNPQQGVAITTQTLMRSIMGRQRRQFESVNGLYMSEGLRNRVEEVREGG